MARGGIDWWEQKTHPGEDSALLLTLPAAGLQRTEAFPFTDHERRGTPPAEGGHQHDTRERTVTQWEAASDQHSLSPEEAQLTLEGENNVLSMGRSVHDAIPGDQVSQQPEELTIISQPVDDQRGTLIICRQEYDLLVAERDELREKFKQDKHFEQKLQEERLVYNNTTARLLELGMQRFDRDFHQLDGVMIQDHAFNHLFEKAARGKSVFYPWITEQYLPWYIRCTMALHEGSHVRGGRTKFRWGWPAFLGHCLGPDGGNGIHRHRCAWLTVIQANDTKDIVAAFPSCR